MAGCASTGGMYRSYAVLQGVDRIVPVEDKDVSVALQRLYTKKGIKFLTSTTTTAEVSGVSR